MPRMLDICCGELGWALAFLAKGWECDGIDLRAPRRQPHEIPAGFEFIKADILTIDARWIRDGRYDFVCASTPCEQFSLHGLKCFFNNPPYPELGIRLFNHVRQICEEAGVRYVMENVKAARLFVGDAKHHAGPFWFWGNAVPPLMPQGIRKGTRMLPGNKRVKILAKGGDIKSHRNAHQRELSPDGYAAATARAATIPREVSNAVADFAEGLLHIHS